MFPSPNSRIHEVSTTQRRFGNCGNCALLSLNGARGADDWVLGGLVEFVKMEDTQEILLHLE